MTPTLTLTVRADRAAIYAASARRSREPGLLSPTFLAWLAGFVDGEGCLEVFGSPGDHHVRLTVCQADEGILLMLKGVFGGRVEKHMTPKAGRKQVWRWIVHGSRAGTVVECIRPYMKVKEEQADLVLRYKATITPKGNGLAPGVDDLRAELKIEMRRLKREGSTMPEESHP